MGITKIEKITACILTIISISVIILYFNKFHYGLSSDQQDWGNFGAYISGTIVPILTIVNIWVFYRLTSAIDRHDEERKQKDLNHQRKIIVAQFRQKELDNIANILNSVFAETSREKISQSIVNATWRIEGLIRQVSIFPIMVDNSVKKEVLELLNLLNELGQPYGLNSPIPLTDVFLPKNYKDTVIKYLSAKNKVINILQESIINDL